MYRGKSYAWNVRSLQPIFPLQHQDEDWGDFGGFEVAIPNLFSAPTPTAAADELGDVGHKKVDDCIWHNDNVSLASALH